jgi:hypothetical protein
VGEFFGAAESGAAGVPVGGMGSYGFFNAPTPNFNLQPLMPTDGGAAVGLTLQAVVCSDDGLHAVALGPDNGTGDLRGIYSTNSGVTWAVAGGFPIIPNGVSANSAGLQPLAMHTLTVVARVFLSTAVAAVATSTDGGQTWTDTTPAAATIDSFPLYSLAAGGQFLFFDATNNVVWAAADGATWVSNPLPAAINTAQLLENSAGTVLIAYVNLASDNHVEIWSSVDGVVWVSRLVVDSTTSTPGYVPFVYNIVRTQFATTFAIDGDIATGGCDFYTSNAAGTVWTLQSGGAQPPPDVLPAVFKHLYYTGSNTSVFNVSSDGVAWETIPIPNPFLQNGTWQLSGTGALLMLYTPNVSATPDGINFGPLLVFTGSGFVSAMSATPAGGGYTLAVGVDDSGVGHVWRFAA